MATAKLCWSGGSHAVRLPKKFRLEGTEVRIRRHGATVILEPIAIDWAWLDALAVRWMRMFSKPLANSPLPQTGRSWIACSADRPGMRYLLGANAVVAVLKDPAGPVSIRQHSLQPAEVGVSAAAMHELYDGAFNSQRRDRNLALVDALRFDVLPLDKEDARHAGEIRAWLVACGAPLGADAILSASQVRPRGLTVVIRNRREYEHIWRIARSRSALWIARSLSWRITLRVRPPTPPLAPLKAQSFCPPIETP